jgi:hypothetical protein
MVDGLDTTQSLEWKDALKEEITMELAKGMDVAWWL